MSGHDTTVQKCSYCGRENEDALTTCRECGTVLSAIVSPADATLSSRQSRWVGTAVAITAFVVVLLFAFRPPGSGRFDSLEIKGTKSFTNRVVSALTLLKTKSPQAYEIVTNYIRVIAQARRSGMAAYEAPPTAYLGSPEWETTTSLASGIAHESIHSRLYHDYLKRHSGVTVVPDEIWTGEIAEKQCCEHQMRVLQEIGAPLSEIVHYSWNPSNRYWEVPYKKRNW